MYFIATFEQSTFIELAVTALEQEGVEQERIFAAPLDKRKETVRIFDSIERADGVSMLDVSAVLGTCGMLLGAVYGFELTWGPILWGIIGAFSGIAVGLLLKLLSFRIKRTALRKKSITEVVLIIHYDGSDQKVIEQLLWDHMALGISKVQ